MGSPPDVTTPGAPGPVPLWRQRDFRVAWSAGFVNDTGDWVLQVALPVFVFVETRSGSATAAIFVCQLLASLVLGPIGGTLVDRWDLKRTLVVTNLLQAITILPLLATSADRLWPAYLVVLAQAALTQVNNPANVALVPRVVGDGNLVTANAALSTSQSLARLIGSPLGGVLVAWGGLAPVVLVDAASFLGVAATLLLLRCDTSPHDAIEGAPAAGVRAGLSVIGSQPRLRWITVLAGVGQLAQGGFVVLFVVFVVEVLGDDGTALGVIRGTMAIGALAGAALASRLSRRIGAPALYSMGLIGMGLVALVFWNAPQVTTALWVYPVLFSLSGIPGSALAVGLWSTVQQTSPPSALGRVSGVVGASEATGIAVGSIVTGLLLDRVDLTVLLDAQASIYLATGVLAALLVVPSRDRTASAIPASTVPTSGVTRRSSCSPTPSTASRRPAPRRRDRGR